MYRILRRHLDQGRFSWRSRLALGILLTIAVSWVLAHEGHAPLPTKGAQVDLKAGTLFLSRDAKAALGVQTGEVELRPAEDRVLAYVSLVAPWQNHAYVTARLPGRISHIPSNIKPGQVVAKGQVLAELQSLELENFRLAFRNAQNEVQLATKVVAQLEGAGQEGAVPMKSVLEARTKLRENQNAVTLARAKWRSLGLGDDIPAEPPADTSADPLPSLPIVSPIAGAITHMDLTVGKVVEPAEHLMEVLDISKVWVKIDLPESDLYRVAVGQPVELSLAAYPGELFRTTVQVKGIDLDPQTHFGTAWGELTNPAKQEPRFLPGMNGQAWIVLRSAENLLTVPTAALLGEGAERYVLVEKESTTRGAGYFKRNVVVGAQTPSIAQVREGFFFPGDRVVTVGSHELAPFFVPNLLRLSPEAAKNAGLLVEPVRKQVVEDVLEVDGVVDIPPNHRVLASSQMAGVLQKINVARGQAVHKGEVLAEISSLELQNLQAEFLSAQLQLDLVDELLKGVRRGVADQVMPERRLWETETLYGNTKAQCDSLARKLEAVGLTHELVQSILTTKKFVPTLPVRAPIDGTLAQFGKVLGQSIKVDEPIFEVHDPSRAWVQGFLSQQDLAHVGVDKEKPQPARVRLVADPKFVADGKVVRSGREFATDNRTLSVWVELNEPPSTILQQGMLARLTLTLQRPEPTIAVPAEAIVREGIRAYVFVRGQGGTFERRAVETGRADDRLVEITHGLQVGEPVAIRGALDLQTAYATLR